VDGGVMNPLPFDLLDNVDYIIMIDVSKQSIKIDENSNFKDIILQSTWAMQKIIVDNGIKTCKIPYIVIKPEIESHGVLEFDDLPELTDIGEKEAEKQIDKIKKDIAEIDKKISKTSKNSKML
jgi:predicted acylesterase/phospholipase RssA